MLNRLSYSLLLYLLSPVIWLYLGWRALRSAEYREGFLQRLGRLHRQIKADGIVVHCASVGEARAALPLLEKLLSTYPQLPLTVTTTTPTGKQVIKQALAGRVVQCYLPVDWPGSCERFLKSLSPRLLILMETELWPNLLASCSKKDIPVLLANARLSEHSCKKYQKYPRLTQSLFSGVNLIAAQYPSDAKNFARIVPQPEKIQVMGSIKFDIQLSSELINRQQQLKREWASNRPIWLAASIHPAEFDQILMAHKQLLEVFPDLLLVAVPRHPEKFAQFKSACDKHDMNYVCRSESNSPDLKTPLVVGDTMGEITLFCGIADIAYIGGSLIERGGHNPLEATVCGTPVLMGRSVYNFSDVCQLLLEKGAMIRVESRAQLIKSVKALLLDPQRLEQMSAKSSSVMQQNRGCVARLAAAADKLMAGVGR